MKITLHILIFWIISNPIIAQITGNININESELSSYLENNYDFIEWTNSTNKIQKIGVPELPVKTLTFVIPTNASNIKLDVIPYNHRILYKDYQIPPVQPVISFNDPIDSTNFIIDSTIYSTNNFFPTTYGEIIEDHELLGYHLITIAFYPITYNPINQKISIQDLEYTLHYISETKSTIHPLQQSIRRASSVEKYIKTIVQNPNDVNIFAPQGIELVGPILTENHSARTVNATSIQLNAISEQIPDYIIITNQALKNQFQKLADWKTQKGVPTIIKETEEIKTEYEGADLAEKIHAYLKECYLKWGAGLFVLLGGDTPIIPARMSNRIRGIDRPSDFYYADLLHTWNDNHNNIYREIGDGESSNRLCYIGRIPVKDTIEAKNFINKILTYEKLNTQTSNTSYLKNHLIASAYLTKNSSIFLSNNYHHEFKQVLENFPELNTWYLFDHINCSCTQHKDTNNFTNGEELNRDNFLSALQTGGNSQLGNFHIIYHIDHSHEKSIGTSSLSKNETLSIGDVDDLYINDYLQIIMSSGCYPATFTEDCIAEHFLNNSKGSGGCVAFIGNAEIGYFGENKRYELLLKALYNEKNLFTR